MKKRLSQRGYSNRLLKEAYKRTIEQDRNALLFKSKATSVEDTHTRFITKYNTKYREVHDILQKYWYLLLGDAQVVKFIPPTVSITYRKATSIKDMLVQSEFKTMSNKDPKSKWGLWKCGKCAVCPFIQEGDEVLLPSGRTLHIRHHATCGTAGVVYMMACVCGCFYIGKTRRPIGRRISDHLGDIRGAELISPSAAMWVLIIRFNSMFSSFAF